MVYAVVTDIGAIDMFTQNIMTAVNRVKELHNEYEIEAEILDNEYDIENAMFCTDGINNGWFDDYYDLFPYDAGIDIKIPIGILNGYFNRAIDALADLEYDIINRMNNESKDYKLEEYEIDSRVDQYIMNELKCSDVILDKILHGEYIIV